MTWLDRFRESFRPRTYPPVRSPTATYPTPVELFEHVISEMLQHWHVDGWAHFQVDEPEEIVVQVAPPDAVNTCDQAVDLTHVLHAVGLVALAEVAAPVNADDRTLWSLPHASAAELAQVVHAVFAQHHDLGGSYAVKGWLEA